jgi:hypothetical protein
MSFASLKKNRTKSLDKLNSQLEKITKKSYADPDADKYWKPTRDKVGNGFSIIRFLPAVEGEELPFVRTFDHGFQGPTGLWYIESSLTTLNVDDPVSEYNSKLWNSGIDSDKELARKQKRRLKYISNVLVVKDPANPENEGKVFLYQYGKKIFDKLNDLMNPSFEDESPVNPFDFWEGANFRLKIRLVEGYPNYDKSEFDDPTSVFDDDDEMEKLWKTQHSLQSLLDPNKFKSYAELKTKLFRVLALDEADNKDFGKTAEQEPVGGSDELDLSGIADSAPIEESKSAGEMNSDDDDDLAIFKDLARG